MFIFWLQISWFYIPMGFYHNNFYNVKRNVMLVVFFLPYIYNITFFLVFVYFFQNLLFEFIFIFFFTRIMKCKKNLNIYIFFETIIHGYLFLSYWIMPKIVIKNKYIPLLCLYTFIKVVGGSHICSCFSFYI